MCLALDVLEGQSFAGVDHDGVVPGGSRAAQLPAVDALGGLAGAEGAPLGAGPDPSPVTRGSVTHDRPA
jgi:hypothetical protein